MNTFAAVVFVAIALAQVNGQLFSRPRPQGVSTDEVKEHTANGFNQMKNMFQKQIGGIDGKTLKEKLGQRLSDINIDQIGKNFEELSQKANFEDRAAKMGINEEAVKELSAKFAQGWSRHENALSQIGKKFEELSALENASNFIESLKARQNKLRPNFNLEDLAQESGAAYNSEGSPAAWVTQRHNRQFA